MKNNTQKAFTLVEVLIVIAIIGILAGIVFVSLSIAREKAAEAKYVNYISAMTRIVKSVAVEGAFEAYSVPVFPGEPDTSGGCLGDYISQGLTCWNGSAVYDDTPPDIALLSALESLGPLPLGEVNPYHPTFGAIVINFDTDVRVYAYTGSGHKDLCDKFGWNNADTTPAEYCYTTISK